MRRRTLDLKCPSRLALVGWMALALKEESSELALLALPSLVGLWIYVVVAFDRRMRNGENFL
jgi:hypothetical protein